MIKKETNQKIDYEFLDWRPSDQKVYISDITKANKFLDWTPKINPKRGVKILIDWVNQNINIFN